MFKTTFISATLAYAVTSLAFIATGISAGPSETDTTFVVGFYIGVFLACAAIGLFAGGIAVLISSMSRPAIPA